MFIDYVTLLLVNMAAGYLVLAGYVLRGTTDPDQRRWGVAFLPVGLVATLFGGAMCVTWPLPGPFNSAYGELSVLFGVLFLAAGLALVRGWGISALTIYALVAGFVAAFVGFRFLSLGLTPQPFLTALGMWLSGLGGMMALPAITWSRGSVPWRAVCAMMLVGAAMIWLLTALGAYWMHLESFGPYQPPGMTTGGGA